MSRNFWVRSDGSNKIQQFGLIHLFSVLNSVKLALLLWNVWLVQINYKQSNNTGENLIKRLHVYLTSVIYRTCTSFFELVPDNYRCYYGLINKKNNHTPLFGAMRGLLSKMASRGNIGLASVSSVSLHR